MSGRLGKRQFGSCKCVAFDRRELEPAHVGSSCGDGDGCTPESESSGRCSCRHQVRVFVVSTTIILIRDPPPMITPLTACSVSFRSWRLSSGTIAAARYPSRSSSSPTAPWSLTATPHTPSPSTYPNEDVPAPHDLARSMAPREPRVTTWDIGHQCMICIGR